MTEAAYTSVALILRYFFCAAILYILLRLILQSINEYKEIQRVKSQVAGTYAYAIQFSDPEELSGVKYALLKENSIGRGKRCSIRLEYKGIKRRHATIYRSGLSIWFHTKKKKGVYFNGNPIERRQVELADGDSIEINGVRFSLIIHNENKPVEKKEAADA